MTIAAHGFIIDITTLAENFQRPYMLFGILNYWDV
jgi:hypothetical protein